MSEIWQNHSNLKQLSHSSVVLFHKCPRKYELYKLLPQREEEGGDTHADFGSIVGIGIQHYLEHNDVGRASFEMFSKWNRMLDDDEGIRDKKTFWFALHALDKFIGIKKSIFSNCDLVFFEGKPATELGFSIDFGDGFFYRGFLDALLIDRMRNELVVYEGKTTKFTNVHESIYKHSGQSLGYSLVVDAIAHSLGIDIKSSYKVNYCVWKSKSLEWENFSFPKTYTERALWIRNILLDKQQCLQFIEADHFPMRGESCFDFFRPCQFFGMCETSNRAMFMGETIPLREDKPEKYRFHFNVNDLIEAQLRGVGG